MPSDLTLAASILKRIASASRIADAHASLSLHASCLLTVASALPRPPIPVRPDSRLKSRGVKAYADAHVRVETAQKLG